MILFSFFLTLTSPLDYSSIILLVLISIFLFIFSDKVSSSLDAIWDEVTEEFYEPTIDLTNNVEDRDPIGDFTSLDENTIQVISDIQIKFSDVAGNEEAKNELKEVVKFLRDPESFAKLGAAVPKGVLLEGPPGTGKTLLAKAIAGESGTPFLKISGSQFVELLVTRLKRGAYLHLATDWHNYAEQMLLVLNAQLALENTSTEQIKVTTFLAEDAIQGEKISNEFKPSLDQLSAKHPGYVERPSYRPITKFENRGLKLGHGVWDLVYKKK